MSAKPDPFAAFQSLRLDKNSPTPIYLQIAEALASLLKSNLFPPGSLLPPERFFCERYGISRMTLRQTMVMLKREGLIESHRGRGTFVAPQRLQKQQQEMRSFTEEIRSRGGSAQSRVISFELVVPTLSTRKFFGLSEGNRVYEICRVRLKDGTPLAVETSQLSQRLAPWLERFDLEKNSLYRILEESYGLRLDACIEEISAELPSAAHRRLLGIPRSCAALVVNRKAFTDTGEALELTRSTYRGDLYSAVVHSVRRKKTPNWGVSL
jgi:GntR family transcriptional regulator